MIKSKAKLTTALSFLFNIYNEHTGNNEKITPLHSNLVRYLEAICRWCYRSLEKHLLQNGMEVSPMAHSVYWGQKSCQSLISNSKFMRATEFFSTQVQHMWHPLTKDIYILTIIETKIDNPVTMSTVTWSTWLRQKTCVLFYLYKNWRFNLFNYVNLKCWHYVYR